MIPSSTFRWLLRAKRLPCPMLCVSNSATQTITSPDRIFGPNEYRRFCSTTTLTSTPTSNRNPNQTPRRKYEYGEERTQSLETAFNYCIKTFAEEEPQINDTLQYLKCTDIQRLAVTVLRTFHLELGRIRTDSSSADAAKIRLLWWKSALNELLNENRNINTAKKEMRKHLNRHGANDDDNGNTNSDSDSNIDIDTDTNTEQTEPEPESESGAETGTATTPSRTIDPFQFLPSTQSTPVLQALRVVRRRYNLNSDWLLNLVNSREMFLTSNTFLSMFELEEYAENTQAVLLYLTMECMEIAYNTTSSNHFKCASHISTFMTILSVIRSIPTAAYNGFICIPDDICMEFQIWDIENEILSGNNSKQLTAAVEHMMEHAYQHLMEAQDLRSGLNEKVLSVMLCSLPAQRYIQRLEKCKCNVFDTKLLEPDSGIGWSASLAWKARNSTF